MTLRIGIAGAMASVASGVSDMRRNLLGTSGNYFVPSAPPNGGYKHTPSRNRKKNLSRRTKRKFNKC